MLGFVGSRTEAEEIKQKLEKFLRDHLKLELSQAKTLITHARTEAARFLGYEVHVIHNDRAQTKQRRSVNARIEFRVPKDVTDEKRQDYTEKGIPIHRPKLLNESILTIISTYQAEYRGLVEYYRMAHNLSIALNWLEGVMESSLVKTLAAKLRISVPQVYKRFHATISSKVNPTKVCERLWNAKGRNH